MDDLRRRPLPRGVLVLLSYVAVFGLLGRRWLAGAFTAIPLPPSDLLAARDAELLVWIVGWVAHALLTSPATLFDGNIFHPAPRQLTGSEACLSSQLLGIPLFLATDNAVAVANLLTFATYPLAAWSMEALGRRLGFDALVAWLMGLLFALGPLRVPANLQVLQYANLHLALGVLALEHLRTGPTPRRALPLLVVTALGAGSSLYMAAMLGVTLLVWMVLAAARDRAGAGRFLAFAVGAIGIGYGMVAAVLHPYFMRHDPPAQADVARALADTMRDTNWEIATGRPAELLGFVTVALALLGLAQVASRDAAVRRAARVGAALVAVGALYMLGPSQTIGGVDVPLPFALLNLHRYGMLRFPWRFVVIVGFGVTLLAGAGVEAVSRRVGGWRAVAVVGLAIALVLGTRGRDLVADAFEPISSVGDDRAAYAAVGSEARARGGGALLELPLARGPILDFHATQHMIASTVHWLPLIDGYTGYPPPHRTPLLVTIARLPDPSALRALRDMNGLRWILLSPTDRWERADDRAAMSRMTGTRHVLERDGWELLEVMP